MVKIIEIIKKTVFFFKIRYLQAMKTEQDEIVLVGKSFSPDIEKWEEEKVHIPKKNESEGVLKSYFYY